MNFYLKLIPDVDRHIGEDFVIKTFGIPEGFSDCTYRAYLKTLMADAQEYYITDARGYVQAYMAYNVSEDIHRQGNILDVHQFILNPNYCHTVSEVKEIWELVKVLAKLESCDFVSHYKHVNSSIINYITRRV